MLGGEGGIALSGNRTRDLTMGIEESGGAIAAPVGVAMGGSAMGGVAMGAEPPPKKPRGGAAPGETEVRLLGPVFRALSGRLKFTVRRISSIKILSPSIKSGSTTRTP